MSGRFLQPFSNSRRSVPASLLRSRTNPKTNESPDIKGVSVTGKKVGVEIGEWLNEEEVQAAKQKERVEE